MTEAYCVQCIPVRQWKVREPFPGWVQAQDTETLLQVPTGR